MSRKRRRFSTYFTALPGKKITSQSRTDKSTYRVIRVFRTQQFSTYLPLSNTSSVSRSIDDQRIGIAILRFVFALMLFCVKMLEKRPLFLPHLLYCFIIYVAEFLLRFSILIFLFDHFRPYYFHFVFFSGSDCELSNCNKKIKIKN